MAAPVSKAAPPGADQRFNEAVALHRQGQLALAEVAYRAVLNSAPRHAQALGMLGLIEAGKGNAEAAMQLLGESIAANPENPATHFNLGLVHQEAGRNEEALTCFDRALALRPDAAQVRNARGIVLKNLGRSAEALVEYDHAVRLIPDYVEALNNRGVVLRLLNRNEEAVASFRKALAIRPESPDVHHNLGYALHSLRRYPEALASYSRALELKPDYAAALNSSGMALHQLERFDEAVACYRRALEIDPASAQALMNMGVAFYELKQYENAHEAYRRALELEAGNLDVLVNLGNVLLELNRHEEALASYRHVIEVRPGEQDVLMNMGNALRDLRRSGEALEYYERALALDEACADVHWNRAMCLLAMGDFARGLPEYEWRRQIASMYDGERPFEAPLWLGAEPIDGKAILLHTEQGLGDTIQFCRYATILAAMGARVILEVPGPLGGVLTGLDGVEQLIVRGQPLPRYDCHCPLLSLPFAIRTRVETIPAPVPYLRADPALVSQWSPVVQRRPGPHVGLAWSGNAAYRNDRRRSIPLAMLLEILPAGVDCWSLQKDVSPDDQALIDRSGRIGRFDRNEFVQTAAQINLMDIVISVDTSIGHLAAALGKPTWILLSYTADWRWMWARPDSPWYPTATLLRQAAPGDWNPVLQELAFKLARLPGCSSEPGRMEQPL